ncbi:MAG: hypothetical protein J6U54_03575 [Clostridiales bacterium]|nr:hypothetical protein [Clostridiales bacterium]
MDRHDMQEQYFDWLCGYVGCHNHRKLLRYLYSVPFTYNLSMDANRYEDGVNLRYRFADEKHHHYRFVTAWLDDHDCSVLEMMVALSLRIEEHLTGDPEVGDRTHKWFTDMLKSMGVYSITDQIFTNSEIYVRSCVEKMLNRSYSRNGNGGLFTLRHSRKDLRKVEIWYQAMWYLDEILRIKLY